MKYFDILVPFFEEYLIVNRDVDLHLISLVEELGLFEFLSYFREGELNKQVFGDILNLIRYLV